MKLVCLLVVFLGFVAIIHAEDSDLSHGWGDKIEWVNWEDAQTQAKKSGKPIMVVLHKSWCGACKRLKPLFAESEDIAKLSTHFLMVNAEDEEAPHSDAQFQVDGGYIPRIYFADSDGKVLPEFYNKRGNDKYKYFYPTADPIPLTMSEVAKKFSK